MSVDGGPDEPLAISERLDDRDDREAGALDGIGPDPDAAAPDGGDRSDPSRDPEPADEAGRKLFRYLGGEEWREYRAIMAVFAGTFFSEFSPEDVTARLTAAGMDLDASVVGARLESLRQWGNLTVSSAVGNPTSLADYYRRRNRYLITRAGQEVHDVVEGVLTRVDEVRDVSAGRLRALRDALDALIAVDIDATDPVRLADLVRAVFDPHETFTSEITQFFAAINQWQSRYDLTPEEFTFFAEVLVTYVAERLDEIERTARPIGRRLIELEHSIAAIVDRANRGLAERVEEAGLQGTVQVSRAPGTSIEDWAHLTGWFVGRNGRPSRIDQLGREALSAIRTLTLNLTRLSRVGVGATSRRADFLRLATFFATGRPDDAPALAVASLGLHATNHWGTPATDADDPVSTTVSWWDAPRAPVAISLRERGDTTNRGRATPITDRSQAQELVRRRREQELDAARRVDLELLAEPSLHGRSISDAALVRLQQVLARTLHELDVRARVHERNDGLLRCTVRRAPGERTAITTPNGTLTLVDLDVRVSPTTDGTEAETNTDTPTDIDADATDTDAGAVAATIAGAGGG